MKVIETPIQGLWKVENSLFSDPRGTFSEIFQADEFKEATGNSFIPAQWNQSFSAKDVIRGIHYSLAQIGQAKWVNCSSGAILDVVVDLRQDSPTYLERFSIELSPSKHTSLVIGSGLGHSFLSLKEGSTVNYLLTSKYSPKEEFGINPLDKTLNIHWPTNNPFLSDKDRDAPSLADAGELGILPQK